MEIRKAEFADLPRMMEIYADARDYMRLNGNPNQWVNGYPSEERIREDMAAEESWVCTEKGEILGVFCFFLHNDLTYERIYEGCWLNDEPYGVIHRIAGMGGGVFEATLEYCTQQIHHLRIDTHADNKPMQHVVEKAGFTRRGIIYVADGTPRIAYDRI